MRPSLHRLLRRLRQDERGIGLVEVIVSALFVVLASTGVYMGLDAASATSGINKNRAVASAIAQEDQDRMRAMAVDELSNYREARTTTVGAITYTVSSASSWVTDSTGTASCTSSTARANYLRVSSAVSWPNMKVDPITIESVVAPPAGSFGTNQGSLAVQVRDRNGAGVPGVLVTLTGPKGYSDVTNVSGCVLWGYLPAGNGYTVAVGKTGYVDPSGNPAPSLSAGVTGEATSTVAFDYDLAGTIKATFETWDGSAAVPANSTAVAVISPTAGTKTFTSATPQPEILSAPLFPASTPYNAYAGDCAGADPGLYTGQAAVPVTVLPGAQNVAVAVRVPPIDVRAMNGATPLPGAVVKLTGTGTGCTTLPTRSTGSDGRLPIADRGFPFGPYNFCVQAVVGGTLVSKTTTTTNATSFQNVTATGVPESDATVDFASGTTTGACP